MAVMRFSVWTLDGGPGGGGGTRELPGVGRAGMRQKDKMRHAMGRARPSPRGRFCSGGHPLAREIPVNGPHVTLVRAPIGAKPAEGLYAGGN